MNINVIVVVLLGSLIGFYSWKSFFRKEDFTPTELPWTQISTSKSRVNFRSNDISSYIERVRRTAITKNPTPVYTYKGSTNGSLEYYFISGVVTGGRPLPDICPPEPETVILSNGDATDEVCDVVDAGGAFGGYDVIDTGGAFGNVCDV